MQRPVRNRLQLDGTVLDELWNLVVIEGFVEYSSFGSCATPVSIIPPGTKSAGQATPGTQNTDHIYI
jgi:hypothetical protein